MRNRIVALGRYVLFHVVLCQVFMYVKVTGRCEQDWILWPEGNKCFLASPPNTKLDGESAYHLCKNVHNSSLASLENYAGWKFVNHNVTHCLAEDQLTPCDDAEDRFWLGIYRPEMANPESAVWDRIDGYIWVDGSPYNRDSHFYLWGSDGEPVPHTQCAILRANGYLAGQHCIKEYRYICAKDALPETTTPKTSTTTAIAESTTADSTPSQRIVIPSPTSLPSTNSASSINGAFMCYTLLIIGFGALSFITRSPVTMCV